MRALARLLLPFILAPGFLVAAQEPSPEHDVATWQARAAAMREACTADRASAECRMAVEAVQSDMARALLMATQRDDRDVARETARRMLALKPPNLRTAAAYALANLGPEPKDTATLIALLNDPAPTLRRAAYGALSKSPDPAAREWVLRAKPQATGERFTPDLRPLDAATLGVALPAGAAPVWFEMQAWMDGGQVFLADGAPDEALAHFSGVAGKAPQSLAAILPVFAADAALTRALQRYANAAWFENPQAVILAEKDGKPTRLAIVWRDVLFGRTGFALQWAPPRDMPGQGNAPWRDTPGEVKLDVAAAGAPGSFSPDWRKPGADELENAIFLQIYLSDGVGAPDYLERFPGGHYRAEVEALLAKPRVSTVEETLREPTQIRLRFENMPTDRPISFDLTRRLAAGEIKSLRNPTTPNAPTEPVSGQAAGEVVWKQNGPLRPGLYDIRFFYGPFEMDWDPDSIRKYLPGDEAQFRKTIRILPRAVKIATDKADYAPNEVVTIDYEGMPLPGSPGVGAPFLTIVKADAPARDWQAYAYTKEENGTVVALRAPTKPGAYHVRARFEGDDFVRGVASITVLDVATVPTPAAPPPEPAKPKPIENDPNIVITPAKPVFAPQEPIVVTVKGLSGDKRDWIAVVPAGAEEGAMGQWVYSGGATEGSFTLPGQAAGAYEIRIRFRDQYRPVRAWLAIEVK